MGSQSTFDFECPEWVLGVILCVLASITDNIGLVLQKYSHLLNNQSPLHLQTPYYKQIIWQCGVLLYLLGSTGNLLSLGLAAQSLLAPLGSVALICNAINSHFFLKERFTCKDAMATCLLLIGSVLIIVFSDHHPSHHNLAELLRMYERDPFIVYFSFLNVVIVSLLMGIHRANQGIRHYGMGDKHTPTRRAFLCIAYPTLAGLIGSETALFGKSASEMIITTMGGDNQFQYVMTYIIITALLFTGALQIHFVNLGLHSFDATAVVPTFYVVFTVFSIIGGIVYFDEIRYLSVLQIAFFGVGLLFTFGGVMMLCQREKHVPRKQVHAYKVVSQDSEADEKVEIQTM